MKDYILGSHNSWSYLKPQKWWLRPFAFMAKCQSVDIKTQYEKYGVRCFDLRILHDSKGDFYIAHGFMKYNYGYQELMWDLQWLDNKGDCYVRVLNEARRKSQYTEANKALFVSFCDTATNKFPNIKWWCGRNLYNWEFDYNFPLEPSCCERYASVTRPRLIDDWWPWLYARVHNREIRAAGTTDNILLIDYVNIP